MRIAPLIRMTAVILALPLANSCTEPEPSRIRALTGLWEISATFTEYEKSDYTTIPVLGPSLHGSLTIDEPSFQHGDYFTWDGVKGAFVAQPCDVIDPDGQCTQLGREVALDGSGSITLGPEGPGESGSNISVDIASGGVVALLQIEVQGNTMTGQAGWIPMFGERHPPSYGGTFVAHRKCSIAIGTSSY